MQKYAFFPIEIIPPLGFLVAVYMPYKNLVLLLCALFSLAGIANANLIINGNFESGNTGFQSDYTYLAPNGPMMDEGQYSVVSSLGEVHAIWAGAGSLSAQSGSLYFVANGSPNTSLSPWMQTISVNSSSIQTSSSGSPVYYRFQAYVASVYPDGAQPELAFEMSLDNSGIWQELTTSSAPPSAFNWYLTYRDGYFPTLPSTVSFRLRNAVSGALGNDLAIDSLYFGLSTSAPGYGSNPINSIGAITGGISPVPEPGQIAASLLLLAGIGGYAFLKRRKTGNPATA